MLSQPASRWEHGTSGRAAKAWHTASELLAACRRPAAAPNGVRGAVASRVKLSYHLWFTALRRRAGPAARLRSAGGKGRRMFEGIQRGLSEALKKLRGRGRITEANVREGMQEVRKALLDADVNYTVANDFIAKRHRALRRPGSAPHPRPQRADRQHRLRRAGPAHGAGRSRASTSPRIGRPSSCCAACRAGQDDHGRQARPDAARARPQAAAGRRRLAAARRRRAAQGPRRTDRRAGLQRAAARPIAGRRLPQRRRPRQEQRCSTPSSSTRPAGCTSTKCRWTS